MPQHNIPIPFKPKSNPGQIRAYCNVDDELEIANLLNHLSPERRVEFLRWACSQSFLPGSWIHPGVGQETIDLAKEARHCDAANERLTMDILLSISHLGIDYAFDFSKCLEQLVLMARGKDVSAPAPAAADSPRQNPRKARAAS